MWCRNPGPYRRWVRRAVTVAVTTGGLLLVARGAWADCTNLWTSTLPDCLMRKAGGVIAGGIAGKIAEGVSWLAKQIGDGARTAGHPDVAKQWFGDTMINTRELGVLFAIVGMLLSIIYAALKRDVHEIGRTLIRVLAAGLTTGGITVVVATANSLVDDLCDYVLGPRGWAVVTDTFRGPIQQLGQVSGYADPSSPGQTTPSVIAILIGAFMLITFAVIWGELLLRRVAIDLCVLFWPLAVSGAVWANARMWTRRLVDSLAGLVLSKLVIVLVLKFAANALTNVRGTSDLVLAAGVFAAAAFAPYWVMKLIGFIGGAIQPGHTGEGMRAAAVGAVTGVAMTATRVGITAATGGGAALAGTAAASATGGGKGSGPGGSGSGMRPGGRTPMPSSDGAAPKIRRTANGGTPAGQTSGARTGPAASTASPGRPVPNGQTGGSSGASTTAGQKAAGVSPHPTPPPSPRMYPASPVPPHLRPAPSAGAASGDASGSAAPTPPGQAPPRSPVRRPEPWPGPRRGDPSAPMYGPPPPPPAPPRGRD
jgi:hypothetical protein